METTMLYNSIYISYNLSCIAINNNQLTKISRALGRITENKEKLSNDKLAMASLIHNIKFRE